MLFSFTFGIGLLVLGLLYIGDLYLDSFINLMQVSKDIENEEKDKRDDEDRVRAEAELKNLTKHIYS